MESKEIENKKELSGCALIALILIGCFVAVGTFYFFGTKYLGESGRQILFYSILLMVVIGIVGREFLTKSK